jgi:hypothetical protein
MDPKTPEDNTKNSCHYFLVGARELSAGGRGGHGRGRLWRGGRSILGWGVLGRSVLWGWSFF